MTRHRLVVALALSLGACSDPQFPADALGGSGSGSGGVDTSDEAGERCAPSGWSCREIGECANGCGTNLDCIAACQQEGCDESKEAFGATTSCAQNRCLMDCIGGFNEACEQCMSASCAEEAAACESSSCPESCDERPADESTDGASENDPEDDPAEDAEEDDPAENGPAEEEGGDGRGDGAPPPPAPATCFEVYECTEPCMFDDCIEECLQGGCDSARIAFTELVACAESICGWECLLGLTPECVGCMMDRCDERWTTCTDDNCAP